MASEKLLKQRISSVNSTMKVTQAMQLVSSSKLKKAKDTASEIQDYFDTLIGATSSLVKSSKNVKSNYLHNDTDSDELIIVISSNTGLCGGYNQTIFREVRDYIKQLGHDKYKLMVLGRKGIEKFQYAGIKVDYRFIENITTAKFNNELAKEVIDLYDNKSVSKISLFHTHFVNPLVQKVTKTSMLPLALPEGQESGIHLNKSIEFEPDVSSILSELVKQYVVGVLYAASTNAVASEYSSRSNTMEAATNNAKDLMKKLKTDLNKSRQARITQEISEIIGGSEALK